MLTLLSIVFGFAVNSTAQVAETTYIPLPQWEAQVGDRFIADTEANIGYIVHENGDYTSMRIGSGRKKVVRYAGRTYDATTPETQWVVKELDYFGDVGIFGKTGRFMRLYDGGTEYTSYGIHATGNIDDLLAAQDRFKSFGCILVSDEVLDILYKTYELNGDMLDVATVQGIDAHLLSQTPNI